MQSGSTRRARALVLQSILDLAGGVLVEALTEKAR